VAKIVPKTLPGTIVQGIAHPASLGPLHPRCPSRVSFRRRRRRQPHPRSRRRRPDRRRPIAWSPWCIPRVPVERQMVTPRSGAANPDRNHPAALSAAAERGDPDNTVVACPRLGRDRVGADDTNVMRPESLEQVSREQVSRPETLNVEPVANITKWAANYIIPGFRRGISTGSLNVGLRASRQIA
jgi:hypothetical protein